MNVSAVRRAAGAICLALAPCAASALTLGAHLHTFHVGGDGDLPPALGSTDSTPGLYVRTDGGWTAGIARNSFKRPSLYLGKTWTTDDERWSLTAGAITGYQYRIVTGQKACPHGKTHGIDYWCAWNYGKTSAVLRPLIAPSWAWIEARPYLGGATPRVILLGKGISFALEAQF